MTENWITPDEAVAMLEPAFTKYSARMRICERACVGLIRARAEQFHVGERVARDQDIPAKFWWARGHEALEQDWTAGDFSTWLDHKVELKAFGVTFARADVGKILPPSGGGVSARAGIAAEDEELIKKINTLVPSAALSYEQAALDILDDTRLSFRGPALELREALREVLDHLAPDAQVAAAPGYIQEKDRSKPTMKQKVRFIMKKRRQSSTDPPEQAVVAFEEGIATLTRAVYVRSSAATHVAEERPKVVQLRRYVVAVFHEILGS